MKSDDVLAKIWEDAQAESDWGYSIFNDGTENSPTELYITSPDGQCWKIVAQEHPHGYTNPTGGIMTQIQRAALRSTLRGLGMLHVAMGNDPGNGAYTEVWSDSGQQNVVTVSWGPKAPE